MNADLTLAYITALTGNPETPMDWRVIHDKDRGQPGRNIHGSYSQVSDQLTSYNQQGWGVFACLNGMDGHGQNLNNVAYIRAHVLDLDDPATSLYNYDIACKSNPLPHFGVQTSPNKFHLYWRVHPYTGNDFFTLQQKRLAQLYNGDPTIIDATRVLRVPGFYHLKGDPALVNFWQISQHEPFTSEQFDQSLSHVNVILHQTSRSPLGEESMQAPSLDWLKFALSLLNPNDMDRGEWLSISAAFKQAGWNHATDDELYKIWSEWCANYSDDDGGENRKLWNSIKDTEVGWVTFERRTVVKAYMDFYPKDKQAPTPKPQQQAPLQISQTPTTTEEVSRDEFPEMLDADECKLWFKDCYFIEKEGKIFTPTGRFMNSTQFSGSRYSGKQFIITGNGKVTDDPWKAALRSTCAAIPKVDHTRFLPQEERFKIIPDSIKGRSGLNIYIPATIEMQEGDVSLWLEHMRKVLPNDQDRKQWEDYIAHCIKYPGHKIPYAPMLQSVQGIGKKMIGNVMRHCLGMNYVYQPKAPELVASGSKFNAWMRAKLCIVVDEIKIDERRELVEILKPMITDAHIEIQAKGVDQEMEDNVANWIFFSNHKDAIPIDKNDRRYAIFYSALQSEQDLINNGMDKNYFDKMYEWLDYAGGLQCLAHHYKNYPIEQGSLPHRAPKTSSYNEAIRISRSPMEAVIEDCVEDGVSGFRGGYISVQAVINRVKSIGIRTPSTRSVQNVLEKLGYHELGRSKHQIPQEDMVVKPLIYSKDPNNSIDHYAATQGYQ